MLKFQHIIALLVCLCALVEVPKVCKTLNPGLDQLIGPCPRLGLKVVHCCLDLMNHKKNIKYDVVSS